MGHTGDLVELRVVDEVGSVSMDQGTEGQAVLPASPSGKEKQHVRTCDTSEYRKEMFKTNG